MEGRRMLTNARRDSQAALELAALQDLAALRRQAMPQTPRAWQALAAPFVREHIEGEPCRIIGKVFSWSPLYFDVAILVGDTVVRRKVSKRNVHLARCEDCPY